MTDKFTEDVIAEAMARAEKVACHGEGRCFALPHILSDALASCTPKGRCTVGAPEGSSSPMAGARPSTCGSTSPPVRAACGAGWTEASAPVQTTDGDRATPGDQVVAQGRDPCTSQMPHGGIVPGPCATPYRP